MFSIPRLITLPVHFFFVITLLLLNACGPSQSTIKTASQPEGATVTTQVPTHPMLSSTVITSGTSTPTVSPIPIQPSDPEWLLFISSREGYPAIYAARPDGSGLINLIDEFSGISEVALSPDGNQVAFTANSPSDGARDIFIMDVDGANLVNLTAGRVDENTDLPSEESNPAWSPDGERLVFSADGDIFVIAVDGSELVRLTDDLHWDSHPSWSPDGTRIAFSSDRGNFPDIHLVNPDGSDLKSLTSSPWGHRSPRWSPDGSKVAYVSDQDGNGEIYVMAPDSSNQTNLTQNPAEDSAPLWSPDGLRLIFVSDRDGHSGNYLMNAGGSSPVPLPEPLSNGRIMAWGFSAALTNLARVTTTVTLTSAPTQLLSAEQEKELALLTLHEFFSLLHVGKYEQAAILYGGSYEILMEWNPTLHPRDHPALLKNACEINGLQCLRVRKAIMQEQTRANQFIINVEFEYDDGTLFVRGPCCGAAETEMPPVWQFLYTVKRVEGIFQVMELPVYVP